MQQLTELKAIKKTKRMTFSENILDGIDYVDKLTCYELLKSIVPDTINTSRTPYLPIRQLINFFDPKKGARRQMAGGAGRFCDCVMLFPKLVETLEHINYLDSELINLIYAKPKILSASELIRNAQWKTRDILTSVQEFMVEFDKSGLGNKFSSIEALTGSQDGKRIGLFRILFLANQNMNKIIDFLDKLECLTDKGKNPLNQYLYH